MERLKEKKDDLDEDLELVFEVAWDDVVESKEGVEADDAEEDVEGEGACNRDILGS